MKNIIHNSDFQVWQNGTSFNTMDYGTTADRFVWFGVDEDDARYTISRNTDVPDESMAYSWNVNTTTASSENYGAHVRYGMEGFDLKRLWKKESVLSWWAKSNKTGIYCLCASNSDDRSFIAEYTIDAADTWELKQIVIPFDTLSGGTWNFGEDRALKLRWSFKKDPDWIGIAGWQNSNVVNTANQVNLFSSINNYYRMAAIQLHAGNTAQEYEPSSYLDELQKCYRYQVVFDSFDMQRTPSSSVATTSVIRIPIPISVPMMRAGTPNSTLVPFATLLGTRGTDWRLRTGGDNTNTSGAFNGTSSDLGRKMPSLRFEDGTYTAGERFHIQFLTDNAKLRLNAEIY